MMEPAAYIVTDNRGRKRLVFADSVGYRNAVLFKEELQPLVSLDTLYVNIINNSSEPVQGKVSVIGNDVNVTVSDGGGFTSRCVMADYKGHENLADMISTHIHNWRDSLTKMKEYAKPLNREDGTDDQSYWEHELKALTDIENAVKQLLGDL